MGALRRVLGRLASGCESWILAADEPTPPVHLRWRYFGTVRRDAYRRLAAELPQELLSRGLQPHHRVLDVGCGLGPLALGLMPYLTRGTYDGFDVHAEAVAWCQRTLASRCPRFRFRHADLVSSTYNPQGTLRAAAYCFPYEDDTFDFALLSSLCTHLRAAETAHYLHEVARVLKPEGKCVAGFYLLHDESRDGIEAGTSFLPFAHALDGERSRVVDPQQPEAAVAHPEEEVRSWYAASGLKIQEPIRRGRWWAGAAHSQDVLTAVKPIEGGRPLQRSTCEAVA